MTGCSVAQEQCKQWADRLVTQAAPFFLTETLCSLLPREMVVFKRQEFAHLNFALAFHDAYTTYAVHAPCQHVTFLRNADLLELSSSVRHELLYTQWQCGRGQVYDWETVSDFFKDNHAENGVSAHCIDTPAGVKFVLDFHVWQQLLHQRQVEWLRQFIEFNHHTYPTIPLSAVDRREIEPLPRPLIQLLANPFADDSGPNCFSTTLAAITENPVMAQTISTLWLRPEPFMQGLAARGYRELRTEKVQYSALANAVCVWQNQQNIAQHACYVIGNGLALNKNSQAWYAPRHLAYLTDVIDHHVSSDRRV